MADTTVQHEAEAEAWVVEHGLPKLFPGMSFSGKTMNLTWGGQFAFDAVSSDKSIVVSISTSGARTASGKQATAKFQKIKTDALYLLHLKEQARSIMVFTERSMQEYFRKAADAGRFPPSIELLYIPLPADLHAKVISARKIASDETTPRTKVKNTI